MRGRRVGLFAIPAVLLVAASAYGLFATSDKPAEATPISLDVHEMANGLHMTGSVDLSIPLTTREATPRNVRALTYYFSVKGEGIGNPRMRHSTLVEDAEKSLSPAVFRVGKRTWRVSIEAVENWGAVRSEKDLRVRSTWTEE